MSLLEKKKEAEALPPPPQSPAQWNSLRKEHVMLLCGNEDYTTEGRGELKTVTGMNE